MGPVLGRENQSAHDVSESSRRPAVQQRIQLSFGFGVSEPTDPQCLHVYVRQLRQKIEEHPERPQYLLTEIGVGYRLRAPD
jgi:DNA-binding response OmpR family regulator